MPGKKMDLKKVRGMKVGVSRPSMKVGKGMKKSGRIKGRKKGGRV